MYHSDTGIVWAKSYARLMLFWNFFVCSSENFYSIKCLLMRFSEIRIKIFQKNSCYIKYIHYVCITVIHLIIHLNRNTNGKDYQDQQQQGSANQREN